MGHLATAAVMWVGKGYRTSGHIDSGGWGGGEATAHE
jgi:hypothetical protein